MLLRWLIAPACARACGCTTNNTTNVTNVVVAPEGGSLGDLAPGGDGGMDATGLGPANSSDAEGDSDALASGDADIDDGAAVCPFAEPTTLEAGSSCSFLTGTTTPDGAVAFPCPACAPNAYLCTGGDYPSGAPFADAGVVLAATWVCMVPAACVPHSVNSIVCSDGGQAYTCPFLPDGGGQTAPWITGCWTPILPSGGDICCP